MGIESAPRSLAWLVRFAALAVLTAVPTGAFGQAPPSRFGADAPTDQYGNPMPGPYGCSACCDDCDGGPYGYPPEMQGGFTGPFPMGAGGTTPPVGYDLMNDAGAEGFLVDQRGPH